MAQWVSADEPLPALLADASGYQLDDFQPIQVPGLIACGDDLDAQRLTQAYSRGLFPWFTEGQPVLWWSPDPRMVLVPDELRIRRSLGKTLRRVAREHTVRLTLNHAFSDVIQACAGPRTDQEGTWITRQMIDAYLSLHDKGLAHSVEVWRPGTDAADAHEWHKGSALIGGLYGVSIGRMFFGESMFARHADASKIALIALVRLLQKHGFDMIDCQQNTRHLASFGAREIPRSRFLAQLAQRVSQTAPDWHAMKTEIELA